jgi:hypothetical protein
MMVTSFEILFFRYVSAEKFRPAPSIRLCVPASLTKEEVCVARLRGDAA